MTSPSTTAVGRSTALAGIGFMLVSVFLFGTTSAIGKWLVVKFPVGEFLLLRSVAILLLLIPFIWRAGKAAFANAPRPGMQLLRVTVASVEIPMFFWAVSHMPLADTQTFYLAGPIYVTALSVLLLGERVGWRRWSAVLIGFAGVVIALRPSTASLTLPALIALTGSGMYALLMIITRSLRDTDATVLMTYQSLGILLFGAVAAPFAWVAPSPQDLMIFLGIGATSVLSQFCVVQALKLADASVVVPYQYTLIIWAVVFGWLMFGELPDAWTMTGAATIVAAGLYIFWREKVAQGRRDDVTGAASARPEPS